MVGITCWYYKEPGRALMVTKDLGSGFHIYIAGHSLLGHTPVWHVLVYTYHPASITKAGIVACYF